MNATLATICEFVLLIFVPALVAFRFLAPKRIAWWALALVVAVASWVLINLTVYFSQAHTTDLVMQAGGFDQAPQALLDDWANDGGPKTFAFLFGWLPGLALLVPCLAFYGVAHLIRVRRGGGGSLLSNTSFERTHEG
jgi:hypothetical protein